MELERISMENFRQFPDETVDFAQGGDRNVTVIHGSNGAGKTTLLNAFTWLFYGEVDFDSRPERLANEGAMAAAKQNEEVSISVELQFDHQGTTYIAKREGTYRKRSPDDFDGDLVDMDVSLKYRDGQGWSGRGNPSNTLDQIIPERLSGLFFFDGEDIDELAGIDNQDRIQEAVQNIMGLTILERATRHLGKAAGRFEDEVEEHASEELAKLIEEKRSIEADIDDAERKLEDTSRAIERIDEETFQIEGKLERLGESAALQENRKEAEEVLKDIESEVKDINDEIRANVSDAGFTTLAMPLLNETADDLDEMREAGLIPSELSNSYIDSMLESGECLCGRPLEPGTEHHHRVEAMKGETVADGVEQEARRIVSRLSEFTQKRKEFFSTVDELIEERQEKNAEKTSQEELLDEISSELKQLDQTTEAGESVKDLERRREEKVDQREEKIEERGRIEQRIESLKRELGGKQELGGSGQVGGVKKEIHERQNEREDALLAKRRQQAAEAVKRELEASFANLKDKVRKWANEEVRSRFGEIASKNLTAEITPEFKLKIWQEVGDNRVEVDKSTGERQIASLAFIGSLVNIARSRYEEDPDAEYFTGGIYPLVMDSPFGALDKSHRRQVSRVIPTLANQVVVLATDSQWEGPVQTEMSSIAGEQYWLDFDPGDGQGSYPQARIKAEQATVGGD
jgi:DNA sulfur modification protein DndD